MFLPWFVYCSRTTEADPAIGSYFIYKATRPAEVKPVAAQQWSRLADQTVLEQTFRLLVIVRSAVGLPLL